MTKDTLGKTFFLYDGDTYLNLRAYRFEVSNDNPPNTTEPLTRKIPYIRGRYEYRYELTQSQSVYLTIAARQENKTAPTATIELPWQTAPPKPPANQLAKE